jgi:hypothetical protein
MIDGLIDQHMLCMLRMSDLHAIGFEALLSQLSPFNVSGIMASSRRH